MNIKIRHVLFGFAPIVLRKVRARASLLIAVSITIGGVANAQTLSMLWSTIPLEVPPVVTLHVIVSETRERWLLVPPGGGRPGPPGQIMIRRTGSTAHPLYFRLSVGGTARYLSDYTVARVSHGTNSFSTRLGVIPSGAREVHLRIIPGAGSLWEPSEPDETVVLRLEKVSGDAVIGTPRSGQILIRDRGHPRSLSRPKSS